MAAAINCHITQLVLSMSYTVQEFFYLDLGFSVVDVTMRTCFYFFGQPYLALGANLPRHSFGSSFFGN